VARANSQVTDTVDAALALSAEQWTAQGPYRADVFIRRGGPPAHDH
jgi:hypothetical protein